MHTCPVCQHHHDPPENLSTHEGTLQPKIVATERVSAKRISELEQELWDCRQQCSEARHESEDLRLFLDSAEGFAFIRIDPDKKIVGWSRGAELILGHTEPQIFGETLDVVFTAEDRAAGVPDSELRTALEVGHAEDERWHIRGDGSRFWGSGITTVLRSRDGNVRGFGKVMRDLTARMEREQQLRESEERFRLFSESVTDYALFQVNPDGLISGWNTGAERAFGYPDVEILGRAVKILFAPEDGPLVEEDLRDALLTGRSEYERILFRRDGTGFWARWVTSPIRDSEGQLRSFAKVLRDVTERKRAEQDRAMLAQIERERLNNELHQTAQVLDRTREDLRALTASLITAHEDEARRIARDLHDELGQGLALLNMEVMRLRQEPPGYMDLHSRLDGIERRTTRLADEARRLSHQLHPAILEDLGLGAALRQIVEELERNHSNPVLCCTNTNGIVIPLPASTALYRIAQEALRNSVKHAPGELITLELSVRGEQVVLVVEDNGPGFDPSTYGDGGGLGLISMQERTYLQGGVFELASAPGKGTRIQVKIPLIPL